LRSFKVAPFWIFSRDGGPFEIVRLVDVAMGRHEVVHDDKVDLPTSRQLDPMQAIEARDEGVRVVPDVLVVLLEDTPKELVLGVVNRFDDEAVIPGKVKEGT
jgi:hypothetical protein